MSIKAFQELIDNSKHIVFFGGAGVSTESGIPDFRSKDGLYNTLDVAFEAYSPEYLLSHECLVNEPKVFFEFYRQKMNPEGFLPNAAHITLAKMEAAGKLDGVVTQNIDGLHQLAGSKVVAELHGSTKRNYCMSCGKVHDEKAIFDCKEDIPRCDACGGVIRPDVTLYGEGLPNDAWNLAGKLIREADLLIVGGTSLAVAPASYLVHDYRGKNLVIINRERISVDGRAALVIRENIGEVFSQIEV